MEPDPGRSAGEDRSGAFRAQWSLSVWIPAVPGGGRPRAAGGRESQCKGIRLFEQALGLEHPWHVEKTEFDPKVGRLDLHLNFEAGGVFECGGCGGEGCKAYDAAQKRWTCPPRTSADDFRRHLFEKGLVTSY